MANPPPPPNTDDDYSPATTLILFPRPLPLLRGPIKSDDPSSGPYLLTFDNPSSWAHAYTSSRSLITAQCESGARIGCSISASAKCRPPWWKFAKQDLNERAKCEEREMEACFVEAKEKCGVFAKEKCSPAFVKARVGLGSVDGKEVYRLICGVCCGNKRSCGVGLFWDFQKCWGEFRRRCEGGSVIVRGRDLLGGDDVDIEDYLRRKTVR